jgi:L-histidine N-alpha-methyltransferase
VTPKLPAETVSAAPARIDVHVGPADLAAQLRGDVRRGLTSVPKAVPPKWFYDERGSALFDEITRLPEYYLTRREHVILEDRAGEIAELSGANVLLELGAGTCTKSRILLEAMAARGTLSAFVPFDVSESALREAAGPILSAYPRLLFHGIVADFERHLGLLPRPGRGAAGGRGLVAFLGSTIGNLVGSERAAFFAELASVMNPGDAFLLGTDLVKDAGRLEAAYDDSAGVTAAFNRNLLSVLNRELGADFVPERFEHLAFFDPEREWIEMRLRSTDHQVVRVPALSLEVTFEAGEEVRTEISAKFRREGVESELAAAGLELGRWWTDPDGDFALSLSFRR